MSDRSLRRMAVAAFAGWIFMVVVGFLLKQEVSSEDFYAIPFFAFTVVGLVVALRHPRNAVAWVFLFAGLMAVVSFFTSSYGFRGSEMGWRGARVAEWVSSWAWFPGTGSFLTFGFLLFPDGRLPSRRWRWAAYASALMILTIATGFALEPGPMETFDPALPAHDNPFGWESGAGLLEGVLTVAFPVLPLLGFTSLLSLVFRYRHSGTEQRQQIKWFGYSALVLVGTIALENVLERALGAAGSQAVFLFGMVFPSVGVGIGILKYRLYDIDVVINRTLVYLALTAILAATYLGVVVLLQQALGGLTEDSDLAVAGSTLAVAALFRPVRSSVQAFIDQRFYRRRYDAAATLDRFSSRLRDQVDLEALGRELVEVVGDTMQPSHASLWIRQEARS